MDANKESSGSAERRKSGWAMAGKMAQNVAPMLLMTLGMVLGGGSPGKGVGSPSLPMILMMAAFPLTMGITALLKKLLSRKAG